MSAPHTTANLNTNTYSSQPTPYPTQSQTQANVNAASDQAHAGINRASDQAQSGLNKASDHAQSGVNKAQASVSKAQANLNTASANASAQLHRTAEAVSNHPVVQQAAEATNRQLNALDRVLAQYGFMNDFEAKTNVPKTYGVLGLGSLFALLIIFNIFGWASPVTNLIGWALPAYLSCAALESPSKGDDKQWLTYWVVFGFFNFLESAMLRPVLYYFPYYFTGKLFFTTWLMLPSTRGAEKVYYNAVKPLFRAGIKTAKQSSATSSTTNTNPNFGAGTSTLHSPSASTSGYSTSTSTADSRNPFVSNSGLNSSDFTVPQAARVPLPDSTAF